MSQPQVIKEIKMARDPAAVAMKWVLTISYEDSDVIDRWHFYNIYDALRAAHKRAEYVIMSKHNQAPSVAS